MGMVACFASLPAETLGQLQHDPNLIEEYLYPDGGDSEPPNYFDLDKAWHGIHYLLTGEAEGGVEPQCLAVLGGTEFGPELAYGSPRFLTIGQVARVAETLTRLPPESLANNFNARDMASKGIYPQVIWVRDGKEALDYVLEGYEQLQVFYQEAASRGDAVIQWLS